MGVGDSNVIGYVSTEYLNTEIPEFEEDERIIATAFQPVIAAQRQAGNEKTAFSILPSIKNSILPPVQST